MPIPGNLTTITVTGEFLDANGNPLLGTVSFAPPMDIYDAGGAAIISKIPYVASLSPSTGGFSISLPCTDNAAMNPTNWGYTITITLTALSSGPYSYSNISIPHTLGSTVDLTGLLPPGVPTTPTPSTYGLLASANTWAGTQTYQQASNGTWAQSNVSGDTNQRFSVDTSGKHQWGPGNAALDTDLYRSAAATLKTDGALVLGSSLTLAGLISDSASSAAGLLSLVNGVATTGFGTISVGEAASGNPSVGLYVSGDTVARHVVTAGGKHQWGPGGSSALDTDLYRSAAATLKTDGALVVGSSLTLAGLISDSASSSAGLLSLVNSTATTTNPGTISVGEAASGNSSLGLYVSGDTIPRFTVTAAGKQQWGPGGSSALDTNLYRVASGTLQTDQSLIVATALTAAALAGVHPGTSTTAETWQIPGSLGTNWATGPASGTFQPIRYRVTADGMLELVGCVHSTSTSPSSTVLTLPTGYYNTSQGQRAGIVQNQANTLTLLYANINTSGTVTLNTTPAATNVDLYFDIRVPLT